MLFDFIEGYYVFDEKGNISYGIAKKCNYGETAYVLLVNMYTTLEEFLQVTITKEKYNFYKKMIQNEILPIIDIKKKGMMINE